MMNKFCEHFVVGIIKWKLFTNWEGNMVRILFLLHDLGQGGAEKVLVNLVNNMDRSKFDITVITLFGGGVNEQFLLPHIRYQTVFKRMIPGNSKLMKLLSPQQLHRLFVKEQYDIEIAYLEGPSARVISGCCSPNTRLISWVHGEQRTRAAASRSFRSEREALDCYNRFNQVVCVSDTVKRDFESIIRLDHESIILYNTVESEQIRELSKDDAPEVIDDGCTKLVAVGTLKEVKGFDRLLRIMKRLKDEGKMVHLYLLGQGKLAQQFEQFSVENRLDDRVTMLGYQTNPYKYVEKCDLFVCSSYSEGFSTAATEALIVGTPVVTTLVSGMKEMLGENNEYGLVTENSEEALYQGIKQLLDHPDLLDHYRKQAAIRGKMFSTENAVRAVEEMLMNLYVGLDDDSKR